MLTEAIMAELREAVGADGLIHEQSQLQTYDCDGLLAFRSMPDAVVLPRSTEQTQRVISICARHKITFVGRGAGTGLSGGATASEGGVIIAFSRMNQILKVD